MGFVHIEVTFQGKFIKFLGGPATVKIMRPRLLFGVIAKREDIS